MYIDTASTSASGVSAIPNYPLASPGRHLSTGPHGNFAGLKGYVQSGLVALATRLPQRIQITTQLTFTNQRRCPGPEGLYGQIDGHARAIFLVQDTKLLALLMP